MKDRVQYIDLGAGIMILWMIIYHAFNCAWEMDLHIFNLFDIHDASLIPDGAHAFINDNGNVERTNVCVRFPYLHFFMPWFFYKSGALFRKRPISEWLYSDMKKLVYPFFVWSFVGYVLWMVFEGINGHFCLHHVTVEVLKTFIYRGSIFLNTPLWFLLSLFIVRGIANVILSQKESQFEFCKLLLIVILGYIISYLLYRYGQNKIPLYLANCSAGLSFYCLGYLCSQREHHWWLAYSCAILYILDTQFHFAGVNMVFNKLLWGNYLLWMPICLCGIITFNNVCRIVCDVFYNLAPAIRTRPLELIGQYAMPIYVTHYLICASVQRTFKSFDCLHELMPYTIWIILIGYILFLPILCYSFGRIRNENT